MGEGTAGSQRDASEHHKARKTFDRERETALTPGVDRVGACRVPFKAFLGGIREPEWPGNCGRSLYAGTSVTVLDNPVKVFGDDIAVAHGNDYPALTEIIAHTGYGVATAANGQGHRPCVYEHGFCFLWINQQGEKRAATAAKRPEAERSFSLILSQLRRYDSRTPDVCDRGSSMLLGKAKRESPGASGAFVFGGNGNPFSCPTVIVLSPQGFGLTHSTLNGLYSPV
ncbi:hypothetical protein ACVWZM_005271 [Bradyrhizobium sp. USDA 4501]